MKNLIKNLFGKKEVVVSDDEYYDMKEKALEAILGKMHDMVGHAIIPFQVGGAADMYYFPNAMDGTGFATMELIEPDGTGPIPNRLGTYELVAFTKHEMDKTEGSPYSKVERRVCGIFTTIGHYSYEAKLNPGETCEIPRDDDENICLIFDEYKKDGVNFIINGKKHNLLLCMEIFRPEMQYAMEHGSAELFKKLKERGYYPYSDLNRDCVISENN